MGLLDALRRLVNFSTLNKIKKAITGLSDEEFHELEMWMASQVDEDDGKTTFDPYDPYVDWLKPEPFAKGEKGWY